MPKTSPHYAITYEVSKHFLAYLQKQELNKDLIIRVEVKAALMWSQEVWENKIYGRTPFVPHEIKTISEIANETIYVLFGKEIDSLIQHYVTQAENAA